jgi:hypothetical protein
MAIALFGCIAVNLIVRISYAFSIKPKHQNIFPFLFPYNKKSLKGCPGNLSFFYESIAIYILLPLNSIFHHRLLSYQMDFTFCLETKSKQKFKANFYRQPSSS